MNARTKLNVAHANGCLALAALAGLLAGSWLVFSLVLAALVAGDLAAGDIRPRPRGR